MWDAGCGAIPVIDAHDRVVGIITDRDIGMTAMRMQESPGEISACQAMTPYVRSCRAEDDIRTALQTMKEFRVRRLPVLAPDRRLRGILSIDDIVARALAPDAVTSADLIDLLRAVLHARGSSGAGHAHRPVGAGSRIA
jgi:CBS domain-containing protein